MTPAERNDAELLSALRATYESGGVVRGATLARLARLHGVGFGRAVYLRDVVAYERRVARA